jgi:hypothetical protein
LAKGRGNPEHLAIDDRDVDDVCLANAGGVPGHRVQHRLHVTRRIGDYAKNVADRRLLIQRLVPFANDPRELRLVSAGAREPDLWRILALSRYRLTASRFNRLATFLGMPSHCPLPEGSRGEIASASPLIAGAVGFCTFSK